MNLNEAKEILKKNGYIVESVFNEENFKESTKPGKITKYTLLDKHLEYDEDLDPYEVVYGPVSLAAMKSFVNKYTTKTFDEIPLDPQPSEEPEEGFIIVTTY